MRVTGVVLVLACLVLTGCRTPAALVNPPASSVPETLAAACPDGTRERPGLINFGAYIGTWQAHHQRVAQSSDYVSATEPGRVSVRCSSAGNVIVEVMDLTFSVPSGRGVQFALTDLPADSVRIFDHEHPACRTLQYRSSELASQLARDDSSGLVAIAIESSSARSGAAATLVKLQVAAKAGDDSSGCI